MHGTKATSQFAVDVRQGLLSTPKQLKPQYFYDALGSHLFEAICQLPWYPLARAESALLDRHAAEMVAPLGTKTTLVELGCGSGEKLARLARPLCERMQQVDVHLIDVSATALELSRRTLSRLEQIQVTTHQSTYELGLNQAVARRPAGANMLVLFLGSNIGNLDNVAAQAFVTALRQALRPGDGLLLGADLVKPEAALILAYDDPLGVTAAFNKNLLARINTDLEASIDLHSFEHKAIWNAQESRVEMHLCSRVDQVVRIPTIDLEVSFAKDESIWTESSYKYTSESIVQLAERAGFRCHTQWVDPTAKFSTSLFLAQ